MNEISKAVGTVAIWAAVAVVGLCKSDVSLIALFALGGTVVIWGR